MRYTNFSKYLTTHIYMYNKHNPYCPYKEFYTGASYRLFTEAIFYALLKDIVQNKVKIKNQKISVSDGIEILRSLKCSKAFVSHNKKIIKHQRMYKKGTNCQIKNKNWPVFFLSV